MLILNKSSPQKDHINLDEFLSKRNDFGATTPTQENLETSIDCDISDNVGLSRIADGEVTRDQIGTSPLKTNVVSTDSRKESEVLPVNNDEIISNQNGLASSNNKFKTSSEMCKDILNNTGVALLPGSDFGFNPDKMLARLSFTDFDGQEFMKNIDETKNIDENLINKFAPKVVEGVNKLKNWSENL